MQRSPSQQPSADVPMSQITSPSRHWEGAGMLQEGGQTDPSGMHRSPSQQSASDPRSHLSNRLYVREWLFLFAVGKVWTGRKRGSGVSEVQSFNVVLLQARDQSLDFFCENFDISKK